MDALEQEVMDRHIELSLPLALAARASASAVTVSRPGGLPRRVLLGGAVMAAAAIVVVAIAVMPRSGAAAVDPGPALARPVPMQTSHRAPQDVPDPRLVTVRAGDDTATLPAETRAVECVRLQPQQFAGLRRLHDLETLVINGRTEEDVLFGTKWRLPAEAIELFSAFPRLRTLHVAGDLAPGDLGSLAKLQHLEELWLDDIEVVEDRHLQALLRLPSLRRLRIEGRGEIADAALQQLLAAVQFETLVLRGTFGLSNAGYRGLELQSRLQRLDLTAPWYYGGPPGQSIVVAEPGQPTWPTAATFAVDDSVLQRIGKLTSLRELHIGSRAKVSDAGLGHLQALTRLEVLNCNQCIGITTAGLAKLPASLRDLDLSETTGITGLPAHLVELRRLSVANSTALLDPGLLPVGKMPHLVALDLSGCPRLTKACAPILGACAKLEALDLHAHPWLDDEVLGLVAGLRGLRSLDVGSFDGRFDVPTGEGKNGGRTAITAVGVGRLAGLRQLAELDLSSAPALPVAALRALQPLPLAKLALWWTEIEFDDATPGLGALGALWPQAKVEWCEPMEKLR